MQQQVQMNYSLKLRCVISVLLVVTLNLVRTIPKHSLGLLKGSRMMLMAQSSWSLNQQPSGY